MSKDTYLQALTEDDVELIHQGSMRILEEIGVIVDHGEIRSLLGQAGCRIDQASRLAKFPQIYHRYQAHLLPGATGH